MWVLKPCSFKFQISNEVKTNKRTKLIRIRACLLMLKKKTNQSKKQTKEKMLLKPNQDKSPAFIVKSVFLTFSHSSVGCLNPNYFSYHGPTQQDGVPTVYIGAVDGNAHSITFLFTIFLKFSTLGCKLTALFMPTHA